MIHEADLAAFTGSETLYRHWTGLMFTEGAKYLADQAGAYWLLDAVASYQPEIAQRAKEAQARRLAALAAEAGQREYPGQEEDAAWLMVAEIQFWTLTLADPTPPRLDHSAELVCEADAGRPLICQHIQYTDFPLKTIKLYVAGGVLMLPSEY